MKRTAFFLLAFSLLFLPACRASQPYRNDLSAQRLAEIGAEAAAMEEAQAANAEELADMIGTEAELPDMVVYYSANGNSLDEFGIWRTDGDAVKTVVPILRSYLDKTYENNRAYYDSYIPRETPKLRDAEIRVYGSYVVYAVLSAESRARFFAAIEENLTVN